MTETTDFAQPMRRALLVFGAVALGLPWLGWAMLALGRIEGSSALGRVLFYFGNFCSVGGLVAAYAAGGRSGLRALGSRVLRWKVPPRWWLFALFVPLTWSVLAALAYAVTQERVTDVDTRGFLFYSSAASLLSLFAGPIGEELGWRGFLLPAAMRRWNPLLSGLVVGLVWAVWHYPLYHGSLMRDLPSAFRFVAAVTSFSVLFTVLFLETSGSVLLAIVLHWSINVTPAVVRRVLPGVWPQGADPLSVWHVSANVLVTAAVVALRWRSLVRPQAQLRA